MPSLRVMSALAVAALAARPARSFLAPTHVPAASRSDHSTGNGGRRSATNSFRSRVPRSSGGPARRKSSCGALMMGKKKGGAKKRAQAAAAAAAKKRERVEGSAAGAGGLASSAEGTSTAVAEAPSMIATADVPPADDRSPPQDEGAGGTEAIAGPQAVVDTAAAAATSTIADPAVNGTPPANEVTKKPAAAGAEASSGNTSKGFGAPEPKPIQNRLNKAPKPMKAGERAQQPAGASAGGERARSAPPPVRQAGGGMDALSPGLPVTEATDHQKVITDVEFSEPEMPVPVPTGSTGADGEMSPQEMLKYLRDNNLTIDLETMNPVEMPRDPESKMEAMFPNPAANVKAKHYMGPAPKPSEYVDAILALLPEDEPWNGKKIRPLPDLKDFLVANRGQGGSRTMNVITSLMFQAMSTGDLERAKALKGAAICVTKAENTVTGPFRQAVMFAENRMAPCMGSTACEEYAGSDGGDAAATWVVLKACVAEWELRVREIRQEEMGLHDIFRTMPNPTEGLDEERTAAITGSVQAMGRSFSENDKLMKSLPLEMRFMESALGLNTTTEVRRFALQDFCPQEGISPEELRTRVSSLLCGLEQLPPKSYHQLQVAVADVYLCLVEGTPEEYNIYYDNWDQGDENLSFPNYRLDTGETWRNRLREIVTSPVAQKEDKDGYDQLFKEILPQPLWEWAAAEEGASQELPFVMLEKGWYDSLDYLDEDKMEDRRARDAEVEAAKIKDPELVKEGEEKEMSDIFTDFLKEERRALDDFEFSEADFEADDGEEILDGPGPGMEELDLGF